jgi:hypothetical protein
MSLTIDDYDASPEEIAELELAIRRNAAARAQIDMERLTFRIETMIVIAGYEETPFVRPDRAYASLDGKDFDRDTRRIHWFVSDAMLRTRHPVDPARVRVRNE